MSLGRIFSKLLQEQKKHYKINYDPRYEGLFDSLLEIEDIKQIQISNILLLTDRRPRSLVAIAYAIRFSHALKTKLFVLTQKLHQTMIEEETAKYNINLTVLDTRNTQVKLNQILELMKKHHIGLVIIHSLYELSKEILEKSPVPVLLIKIDPFLQKQKKASSTKKD